MKNEPTPEEELDIPTQIGRCARCSRKVMSDMDYVPLEGREIMCEPCVDRTIAGISSNATQSGKVTRRSAPSSILGSRTVAA